MRAGIGLLSILIVAAVIFYAEFGGSNGGSAGSALKADKTMRQETAQISGHDENGVPVSESIKVEPVENDGHLRRLKIVSVVPGGPFDAAFGLRANDEVSEIGGLGVDMNDDFKLAEAQLFESIQRSQSLTVVRAGQKLTIEPKTALSNLHPEMFGKSPGGVTIPMH